jgi:hypothetical protein
LCCSDCYPAKLDGLCWRREFRSNLERAKEHTRFDGDRLGNNDIFGTDAFELDTLEDQHQLLLALTEKRGSDCHWDLCYPTLETAEAKVDLEKLVDEIVQL